MSDPLTSENGCKEIVAAKIGDSITNSRLQIAAAIERNAQIEWLDRRHMEFMSACDLGIQWDRLAKGPTLFRINQAGEPIAP